MYILTISFNFNIMWFFFVFRNTILQILIPQRSQNWNSQKTDSMLLDWWHHLTWGMLRRYGNSILYLHPLIVLLSVLIVSQICCLHNGIILLPPDYSSSPSLSPPPFSSTSLSSSPWSSSPCALSYSHYHWTLFNCSFDS